MAMPRFFGIDYGLERTGAAISDPEGKIAFPLETFSLSAHGSRKALLNALADRARKEKSEALVLGLPCNMDGTENLMCRRVRNFAERLRRRIDLPIYFEPEILSSELACDRLRERGLKASKMRPILDQQAACLILQSFLDNWPKRAPLPNRQQNPADPCVPAQRAETAFSAKRS